MTAHTADPAIAPFDSNAEACVLGSVMLRQAAFDECSELNLRGGHFWRPANETIWNTIETMHLSGARVDSVTVADQLREDGNLENVGGPAYLHELVGSVPTTANASHYAEIIIERAVLRRLAEAGRRTVQMAEQPGHGDVADIITRARGEIDSAADLHAGVLDETESTAISETITRLTGPRTFTRTPWRDLNAAIAGWHPRHLYVVGARPSVGKTTAGSEIALDAARRGMYSLVFSMEMPRDEIIGLWLSSIGSVDRGRMMHRSLRVEDEAALVTAGESLGALSFRIDERSSLSLAQMKAVVRQAQRQPKPVLVIVDYLQLIRASNSREDRHVQVGQNAQGLKDMARDLDVPVVALAQLNRGIEGRATRVPMMSDLRESGQIEQAADVIALLHRETLPSPDVDTTELTWIIAKNRHGATTSFTTRFVGQYARIEDREVMTGWAGA